MPVEPIWAQLLAKALEGKDVKDLLTNVGAAGPAVAAAPAAGAATQGTTDYDTQDRGVMHSTMSDIENALSELHTAEPPQGMSRGLEDDVEREFQARAAARAELARNAQKSLQSQEETAWQGPVGVGEPGTISNRQKTLATTGGGVKPLAMLELSDDSEDEVEDEDALPVEKTAPPTMPPEAAHVPHLAGPAVPTAERSMPPGDAFTSQPWPAARETRPEPVPAPTLPTVPAVPTVPVPAPAEQPAATGPAVVDASQWSIDDVVEWARSKDMDASVLEKLREHEVNGASLLSLDINMLKEIDIIAYGRRFKLASAIDELRHSATTPAPTRASAHMMPAPVPSGAPTMQERPRVTSGPARPAPAIDMPQGLSPSAMAAPVTAPAAAPTETDRHVPTKPSLYLRSPQRDEAFQPRAAPPDTPVAPEPMPPSKEYVPEPVAPSGYVSEPVAPSGYAPEPVPPSDGYAPEPRPTSSLPFGDSASLRPVMPNEPIAQPSVPSVSLDDPAYSGATASDAADRQSVLNRIGSIARQGWVKKRGERYNRWNNRYLILHGMDLIVLRDPSADKVKNLIPLHGYKVVSDESANAVGYTFKIVHDTQRTHYFSFEDATAMRGWMKAIMKATIGRDFSQPVISSYSNGTISLEEAQRMRPRPPSPTSRMRVQLENARYNPGQLTSKDAMVLTSLDKGTS